MAASAAAMAMLQEIMKGASSLGMGAAGQGIGGLQLPMQASPTAVAATGKESLMDRAKKNPVGVGDSKQPDLVASSSTPQIPQGGGPGGITPQMLMGGGGTPAMGGMQMNPQLQEFLRGLQGGMNSPRF